MVSIVNAPHLLLVALFFIRCPSECIDVNNEIDTKLENEKKCKCVIYYQCNDLFIMNQTGVMVADENKADASIQCSDPKYVCCKDNTDSLKVEYKEVKPPVQSTPNKAPTSCGMPRSMVFKPRISSTVDDEFAVVNGEIPWIVQIFQKRGKRYRYKGAGSLIHPKVVLTTQHTVASAEAQTTRVLATGMNNFQELGIATEMERSVEELIKHDDYYSGALYYDIALIILKEPYLLTATSFLNTVCLPSPDQMFNGARCIAASWEKKDDGKWHALRKVKLPIVDDQKCEEQLKQVRASFNFHETYLCAGGEEGNDMCWGDGGAPLVCLDGQFRSVLTGMVSWGMGCGKANVPALYTNIPKLRNWITQQLAPHQIQL